MSLQPKPCDKFYEDHRLLQEVVYAGLKDLNELQCVLDRVYRRNILAFADAG